MTRSSSKPFDELSPTEQSGWNVRSAEPGDTLTVRHPPEDFESEMTVIDKTETEWTTTLLARPSYAADDDSVNPVEIKTVKKQTMTGGTVDRDNPGAWQGPKMAPIQASGTGESKWVRVETGDDS